MLIDNLTYASLEAEVIGRLRRDLSPEYRYHNAEHTLDVIEAAERLSRMEGLDESDRLLIRTAALLHDTGYLEGRKEHEVISQRIARDYLTRLNIDEEQIRKVERMIAATGCRNNHRICSTVSCAMRIWITSAGKIISL